MTAKKQLAVDESTNKTPDDSPYIVSLKNAAGNVEQMVTAPTRAAAMQHLAKQGYEITE